MDTRISKQAQRYLHTQVTTASQNTLVLLMYEGAIKFSTLALRAMENDDAEKARVNLGRAQSILSELVNALDLEAAGELARDLQKLYNYIGTKLDEAVQTLEAAPLKEALELWADLRQGWQEALAGEGKEK